MATSTSDDTEHDPAEQHEPQRGRSFWELREDDQRLLFITFLGGLAANVGLVLIVGLGLAEAHLIHRFRHSLAVFVGSQLGAIGFSGLVGPITTTLARELLSRRTPEGSDENSGSGDNSRSNLILARIGLGVAALLSAILILALVGYAAGVK